MIDVDTFDDGGFALGDAVRVLPLPDRQRFTVVGTIDDGGGFGGQVLSFSYEGAAMVFGGGEVDQVFVGASDGVAPEQLVERLNQRLGAGPRGRHRRHPRERVPGPRGIVHQDHRDRAAGLRGRRPCSSAPS